MNLIQKFNRFTDFILASLDNHNDGASGRKLTGLWIMVFLITPADYIYIFKYNSVNKLNALSSLDFSTWLIIHFVAVGFFMGLVTVQQIIELKTGNVTTTTESKKISITKEESIKKVEDKTPDEIS